MRHIWLMYNSYNDENAHCLECGEPIYGRTDKRFCSGQCRSKYHRHRVYAHEQLVESAMDALFKNYSVLEQLLMLQCKRSPLAAVEAMGFNKDFVTRVTKKGKHLEYRCFDLIYSVSAGYLFGLRRDG